MASATGDHVGVSCVGALGIEWSRLVECVRRLASARQADTPPSFVGRKIGLGQRVSALAVRTIRHGMCAVSERVLLIVGVSAPPEVLDVVVRWIAVPVTCQSAQGSRANKRFEHETVNGAAVHLVVAHERYVTVALRVCLERPHPCRDVMTPAVRSDHSPFDGAHSTVTRNLVEAVESDDRQPLLNHHNSLPNVPVQPGVFGWVTI